MKKVDFKVLGELFLSFCKIGAFTIGGGLAMMPMLQKELIEKKHWMTEEELIDYYAIGQSTPGIIAVNVATFIGYKKAGILGGIIATLGIIFPSVVIITVLARLISSIDDFPWVQKALKGINVSVAALLTDVTINFAKKTAKNLFSVILIILVFCLVYFLNVPSYLIILGSAAIGLCYFYACKALSQNKIKNQGK